MPNTDHPERAGAPEREWVAGLAGREGVGTACPVVGPAAHSVCPRLWLREANAGMPGPATCDPSQAPGGSSGAAGGGGWGGPGPGGGRGLGLSAALILTPPAV